MFTNSEDSHVVIWSQSLDATSATILVELVQKSVSSYPINIYVEEMVCVAVEHEATTSADLSACRKRMWWFRIVCLCEA